MSGKESGYLDMELLRFTTAGSVDDGKSTLIGRLLFDSKAIFEDQMELSKKPVCVRVVRM
ncbi:GTP-binding protein [Marinilabilia salmonicolor]|uniref:GTP-binding protein n=1 Tax=Marinilabilia salmonicolor TaxID=989 RepID=UPI000B22E548|nr:GTP-binding protein [Marinilabilia salmonicolor]